MFALRLCIKLHVVGLRMFRSYSLNAFISLLCLPDCKHECVLSGEMEELPIWWSLRKRDLLRVSSSCLECSASVSFNQWKLLRDKAVSRSCLSNCPGLALFSSRSSQSPSFSSSLAFCNPFFLHFCCLVPEFTRYALEHRQRFSLS